MKVNVDKKFWAKSNIIAKIFLVAGFYLVDIGMRLNNLKKMEGE